MMTACLLATVTYVPIYKAMARAAGNNVVTVKSTKNEVTGAISLTPITLDPATHMQDTGARSPDPERAHVNFPAPYPRDLRGHDFRADWRVSSGGISC